LEREVTALEHGYVPEEHAPDPVTSHGDPTRPGKIGVWLFLASEIMFFVGILGTYIIYRSGSPELFARHGETLSKGWAGLNTLVLIFSSLTMALAVDAAQRGDRKRLVTTLAATLACALAFMGVKAIEYRDKAHHHTIVAAADAPVTVTAAPNQTLYATVSNPARQVFNTTTGAFERSNPKKWADYVIPLAAGGEGSDTYTAVVPAGAAGPNTVNVYARTSAEPSSKDKKVKHTSIDYAGGVFVFDGHVHDIEGGKAYAFEGWQAPYPKSGNFDLHLVSESEVKALPNARYVEEPTSAAPQSTGGVTRIDKARINADTSYGPWKNNFFASYFALTGVHGIHVLGGMVPLSILLVQAVRGKFFPHHTEYTGLYWHFVDLVWIFLFPLLYLI
jgi:cytochrome c oxidase subunit 3